MSTTIPIPSDSSAEGTTLSNTHSDDDLLQLKASWLSGNAWHKDCPSEISKQWRGLSEEEAWLRWSEYLARNRQSPLQECHVGKVDPLDWGLPVDESHLAKVAAWRAELDALLKKSASGARSSNLGAILQQFCSELPSQACEPSYALKALVLAYRLPKLAQLVEVDLWWQSVSLLNNLTTEANAVSSEEMNADQVLTTVLLAGELSLALSVVIPELQVFRSARTTARKSLGEGLTAATDGEGVIHATLLPVLPLLMASWTRSRAIGENLKKGCWNREAETQFEWLVRQAMRLTRSSNGTLVLSGDASCNWPAGVLDTALDLAGDEQDDVAASTRLAKVLLTTDFDEDLDELPEASVESEWSMLAVLASGWDNRSNRVTVDYSRHELGVEVEASGRVLMSGEWQTKIQHNGESLKPTGDWHQQCWHTDEECDFLDLTIELTGGVRLERQILLGKEDGFLMLADVLHGFEASQWNYQSSLPLFNGTHFDGEEETRDGRLLDAKGNSRATVMPLGLAEWRAEHRFGELEMVEQKLQLSQPMQGARLCCPLWIDLQPRRCSRPRTWRQLTVAESLKVVLPEVAVGYRIQVGDAQWMSYRSLAPKANRTVLGQNTAAEMLMGRFHRNGEFEEILAVDPA